MSDEFRDQEDEALKSGSDPYGLAFASDWAAALGEGDLDLMLGFYADKAVLVPTFSEDILRGEEKIREYFTGLFELPNLTCEVGDGEINQNLQNGIRSVSGFYVFSWGTNLSDMTSEPSRFTFVIEGNAAGWVVHTHHSSVTPKPDET